MTEVCSVDFSLMQTWRADLWHSASAPWSFLCDLPCDTWVQCLNGTGPTFSIQAGLQQRMEEVRGWRCVSVCFGCVFRLIETIVPWSSSQNNHKHSTQAEFPSWHWRPLFGAAALGRTFHRIFFLPFGLLLCCQSGQRPCCVALVI